MDIGMHIFTFKCFKITKRIFVILPMFFLLFNLSFSKNFTIPNITNCQKAKMVLANLKTVFFIAAHS